ncbi:MAG: enoyl-CoA hydratase/isomerase family protein, partial [Proteobacteria bacterium]|nr:enoyl-CoA hydratase/isomerase family protein [Pseudomonadota bacterium]
MDAEVILQAEGKAGRIRLNRPKAIHALNTGMCAAMLGALTAWREDPAVEIVLIDHAEGRGFCAGGDIRMIATSGAGDGSQARDFFRVEYRLNHALFTYAKPIVAFMDGITMGGGVGISQPARYRVATENTRFAMPETGIGLFPDVGGGWYLSRLPGKIGEYLALTDKNMLVVQEFAPSFPRQFVDISYGMGPLADLYFQQPTPGNANSPGYLGVTQSEIIVSRGGGTFLELFSLTLTMDAPGGDIYYTTDGSLPTEDSILYV